MTWALKSTSLVPDTETLLLNENPASADDDVVAEEAAVALAAVDSEFGCTTDPVRCTCARWYGRIADPRGEIQIAKRIGGRDGSGAIGAHYPLTTSELLRIYDLTEATTVPG